MVDQVRRRQRHAPGPARGAKAAPLAYEPRLPCDPIQIERFRRLLGEDGTEQLFKDTIECVVQIKAVLPADLERVIVDSTVHPRPSRARWTAACWRSPATRW